MLLTEGDGLRAYLDRERGGGLGGRKFEVDEDALGEGRLVIEECRSKEPKKGFEGEDKTKWRRGGGGGGNLQRRGVEIIQRREDGGRAFEKADTVISGLWRPLSFEICNPGQATAKGLDDQRDGVDRRLNTLLDHEVIHAPDRRSCTKCKVVVFGAEREAMNEGMKLFCAGRGGPDFEDVKFELRF